MPSLSPPRLASTASLLGNKDLKGLDAALRAQDSHAHDIARYINKSLVIGDSVQVWNPYGTGNGQSLLVVPTDVLAPATGIGWAIVTAPTYTLDPNGWVEVCGILTGGGLGSNILTGLPAAQMATVRPVNANNAYGRCVISTSGSVSFDVGSTTNVGTFFTYRASPHTPYVPSCFPFDLLWPFNYNPTVILAQCQDSTNQATPSNLAMGVPDWVMVVQGGKRFVRIRNIPSLLPNISYSVQIVGW